MQQHGTGQKDLVGVAWAGGKSGGLQLMVCAHVAR
jgi:hypothetical protein